jgi:ribosomal protein S13
MTMEDNAAIRQALVHIGFPKAAAQALVKESGIDSFDKIALSEDEEITTLCNIIQCLGRAEND